MKRPACLLAAAGVVLGACADEEDPIETSVVETLPPLSGVESTTETAVPLDPTEAVPPAITLDGPFGPVEVGVSLYCSSGVAGATSAEPVCAGELPPPAEERTLFQARQGDPAVIEFAWAPATATVRVASLDDAIALQEDTVTLPDGTWTPAVEHGRYSLLVFVEWGPSNADYAALLEVSASTTPTS